MPRITIGPLHLDTEERVLYRSGEVVPLSPRSIDLLLALLEHPGQFVSREVLRRRVWGDLFVEDSNLSKHLSLLRVVLRQHLEGVDPIRTLPKRGYQFTFAVSISESSATPSGSAQLSSTQTEPVPPADPTAQHTTPAPLTQQQDSTQLPPAQPSASRRNRPLALWITLSAMLILAASAGLVLRHRRILAAKPTQPPTRPSIVVLSFKNLSDQPSNDWLSTALQETLAADLARSNGLRLIPSDRSDRVEQDLKLAPMRSYDDKTLQTIGHLLDCDLALASSYLQLGDQVRLDLQLRNTRTGAVLDSFTQIAPRNKLAQAVTAAVDTLRHDLHLPPPTLAASTALPSLEAPGDGLREYAEGLRLVRAGRPNEAQPYLSRAVLASPHAPLAHIALASVWKSLGFDDRATAEAHTALEDAPSLATEQRLLLEAKAYNLIGNWQHAIDTYTTLRRLYPDTYIYTLGLAQAQLHAGKTKLAIDMLRDLTAHSVPAANDIYVLHTETAATGGLADYRNMLLFAGQELRLAQAQSSPYYEADALGYEGYAWNKLGDSEHAMADYREAERISTAIGDDLDLATVLRYMADIQNTNLDPAAVPTLRRALAIQQKLGNHIAIIDCLVGLGNASLNQLDMSAARASFQDALDRSIQYHDSAREAVVYNDLANVASSTGQPQLELTYATKGLAMARQLQDPNSVAYALNFAADAQQTLGNLSSARIDYQQAIQVAQSIGAAALTAELLSYVASLELDAGNLATTHQLIDRATAMHVQDDTTATSLQLLIARLHIEEGQPALVDAPMATLAPKYTTAQPTVAIEAWRLLAESALLRNDLNTARADIEKALPLARRSPDIASSLIPVSILAARIDAASNHQAKAYADLTALLRTSQKIQNVPLQLEIRLRQGQIERQRGNLPQSTRTLQSVQAEATRDGFSLLARKAHQTLNTDATATNH